MENLAAFNARVVESRAAEEIEIEWEVVQVYIFSLPFNAKF